MTNVYRLADQGIDKRVAEYSRLRRQVEELQCKIHLIHTFDRPRAKQLLEECQGHLNRMDVLTREIAYYESHATEDVTFEEWEAQVGA